MKMKTDQSYKDAAYIGAMFKRLIKKGTPWDVLYELYQQQNSPSINDGFWRVLSSFIPKDINLIQNYYRFIEAVIKDMSHEEFLSVEWHDRVMSYALFLPLENCEITREMSILAKPLVEAAWEKDPDISRYVKFLVDYGRFYVPNDKTIKLARVLAMLRHFKGARKALGEFLDLYERDIRSDAYFRARGTSRLFKMYIPEWTSSLTHSCDFYGYQDPLRSIRRSFIDKKGNQALVRNLDSGRRIRIEFYGFDKKPRWIEVEADYLSDDEVFADALI